MVDGTAPVAGKVVQLANANWGSRSVTTSDGAFSLSAFGPTRVLRVGDDPTQPQAFWLHNVTQDQTGVVLNLALGSSVSLP